MHRERGFHPRRRLVNEDHAMPVRIELISNDPRRPTQRSSSRSVAFVRTSGRRGHPSRKDIEDRQSQDRTPQASQPEQTGRFGGLQRQLPGVTVPAAISQMQEASREMTVRRYRRPVNSAQQILNQDHGQQHTASSTRPEPTEHAADPDHLQLLGDPFAVQNSTAHRLGGTRCPSSRLEWRRSSDAKGAKIRYQVGGSQLCLQ